MCIRDSANPCLRPFQSSLLHPRLWHLNRHSAAGAVAIGLFCGLIPGPLQMIGAAIGALVFRVNLPLGLLVTLYTDVYKRQGLYTQALLKYVQEPGLTIEQVFKNVRREVARATRDGQIPWESSSMTGDFFFIPGSRPSPVISQPVASIPSGKALSLIHI